MKIFKIEDLKNKYLNEWMESEGLEPFGEELQYDTGRVAGAKEFLDFIEDKFNENNV